MPDSHVRPSIDHALLTRFNLPSESGRETRIRLGDGWLTERWQLFTRYCVPGVASQTNRNFSWIIYFAPDTPAWMRDQVDSMSLGSLFHARYRNSVSHEDLLADILDVTGGTGNHLITTNLDNDDGLAVDFIERVQRTVDGPGPRAVYLTEGLIRRGTRLYCRTDKHNAFCSVTETWETPTGCWSNWHNLLAEELPVLHIGGPPGWLQVVHGRNVSNRVRGKLVSPVPFLTRFPDLFDDVPEPGRRTYLSDLLFRQTGRSVHEFFRSILKSFAVMILGNRGMDETRSKLEQLWPGKFRKPFAAKLIPSEIPDAIIERRGA
jgi:hypothetical protein